MRLVLRKPLALLLAVAIFPLGASTLTSAGGSDEPAFTGGTRLCTDPGRPPSPPTSASDKGKDRGHVPGGPPEAEGAADQIFMTWLMELAKLLLSTPR